MTFTALLETRLHLAVGRDAHRSEGQEPDAEAEFAESSVGRLVDRLDDADRRAAALWFHLKLWHRPDDPLLIRAVRAFLTMPLGWTADDAAALAGHFLNGFDSSLRQTLLLVELPVVAAESLSADARRPLAPALAELHKRLRLIPGAAADRADLRRRLDILAPPATDDASGLPRGLLDDDDAYGTRIRAEHGPLLATPGVAALLTHCTRLAKPRPTKKWHTEAARLLAEAPRGAEAVRLLLEEFVRQPENPVTVRWSYGEVSSWRGLTGSVNTSLIRGLLWVAAALDEAWVVPLAGECALYAGIGVGGSGGESRSGVVAGGAIAVLGSFEGPRGEQAVQCLAALRAKVRNRALLKSAERAQTEIAGRAGVTPAQLRERAIPDGGLDGRRVREVPLPGGHMAVLSVDDAAAASLVIRTPAGRVVKAVPKAVREAAPADVGAVRAALKQLRTLLSAERVRLEEQLTAGAQWSGADWQRYYADHPVTGAVAAGLLWEVRAEGPDGAGDWSAGLPERSGAGWCLAGADGTAAPVGPRDLVRLWHPLRADLDEIRAWRSEVTARELRQPFRQVFREIYRLTPAEEATVTYSNRYAAHILRFPQARSLMAARGWSATHLGYWDGGYDGEAVREVPAVDPYAWRARFFYQLVERAEDDLRVALCATDQVRFERRRPGTTGAWSAADLAQVPPLVLSDAMRDVDLFVGVASIAADPTWQDGGEERYGTYWRQAAFGELPASAEVRKEALARLLPRTRIADRTDLAGRFLRVRGDLRTYRIHLGSGNVLMEPDDSYLCIVTARGGTAATGRVFLPFEEDGGMLAVVLSKAFLLADDRAITDPTITRQLAVAP